MDHTRDVTFILHYRKDSEDRERNLRIVLQYMQEHLQAARLYLVHDDKEPEEMLQKALGTSYIFYENSGSFQKCASYNLAARKSSTPFISFWDVDVLVEPTFVLGSLELLRQEKADHIYPFNGKFINIKSPYIQSFLAGDVSIRSEHKEGSFEATELSSDRSPGGCNIITRAAFEKIGGYDERYVGWGFEDTDFFNRSSQVNNVKYIQHADAICWHLEHSNAIRTESPNYEQNKKIFFDAHSI